MTDAAGASFSLTADANNVDLGFTVSQIEHNAYGVTDQEYIGDIADWTLRYTGYYSGSGTESPACKLHELRRIKTCVFEWAPSGSGVAALSWTGSGNLESLNMGFPVAQLCTIDFTLRPRNGPLTTSSASWTTLV